MSFRWPNKDPDEILDYSVDWSRWLDADTIDDVLWYAEASDGTKTQFTSGSVINGLQLVSQTNTDTVATAVFGLGTNNVEYKIYCRITDSSGALAERTIKLRVKER